MYVEEAMSYRRLKTNYTHACGSDEAEGSLGIEFEVVKAEEGSLWECGETTES